MRDVGSFERRVVSGKVGERGHGASLSAGLGARTPAQLVDNLGALEVRIPDDALASLEEASAIQLGFPHEFLARPTTRNNIFSDIKLETS